MASNATATPTAILEIGTIATYLYILREIFKPHCQRSAYWLIRENPTKPNMPNMERFIEYLFEHLTMGHVGLCIERKMSVEEGGYIYSVYDGNNRINAILYFLDHPYKVFPAKYKDIDEVIDEASTITDYDKKTLKDTIHSFDYQTMFEKAGTIELLFDLQSKAWQVFGKFEDGLKTRFRLAMANWKTSWSHSGRSLFDVKISIQFYENYSSVDLSKIFITNKYSSGNMTENDLYAAKLCYIFVDVDTTIKEDLLPIICGYYANRNNDYEQVKQYSYENETKINAFDFIVGFYDYCSNKYNLFLPFLETKNNKENAFFILYKGLYVNKEHLHEDLKEEHFSASNVRDFIYWIEEACQLLKDCVDSLYYNTTDINLFKGNAKRCLNGFAFSNGKSRLEALIFSIILNLKPDRSGLELMKNKISIMLYYDALYSSQSQSDRQQNATINPNNNPFSMTSGNWKKWLYSIKDVPTTLFDKVSSVDRVDSVGRLTPSIMSQLLLHLLTTQSIRSRDDSTRSQKRRFTVLDMTLIGDYYFRSIPNRSSSYSIEPHVHFSAEYEGEGVLDMYRLGNLFPTEKVISENRGNCNLRGCCEDHYGHLDLSMLYSDDEYTATVQYQQDNSRPKIVNADRYNQKCESNERAYCEGFVNRIFEAIR